MKFRVVGVTGWCIAGTVILSWALLWGTGLRLNTSASIPLGFWREAAVDRAIQHGDTVAICPANSAAFRLAKARGYLGGGWCDGSSEILFKPVAAIAGDVVDIDSTGIRVNGARIEKSNALASDAEGRPLPAMAPGRYVVGAAELWLVSASNERSFDSRYFGPLRSSAVRGFLTPVWPKSAP